MCDDLELCPSIGTSDRPCWLAEACKKLLLLLLLQVACILPFMRLGEFVLQAPKLDAAPTAIKDVIFSNPGAALKGIGHALFGWMLTAPVLVVLFAQLLRPIFAWAAQR